VVVAQDRFVSLQNGYHGETLGALSVTDVALFKDVYAPLLRQSHQVPSPDWRLAGAGGVSGSLCLARHRPDGRFSRGMRRYHGSGHCRTAGAGRGRHGHVSPDLSDSAARTVRQVRGASDRRRNRRRLRSHRHLFACEQAGIRPDFLCLSKGITGGYLPLSCVLTRDDIYAAFYADATARGFLHSHSYTGNPLACRAALAVLDIFEATMLLRNRVKAVAFQSTALRHRRASPRRHFRNIGMIWAFEVKDTTRFQHPLPPAGAGQGLFIRPIGNTVYFMPPYVIEEAEMR
jgi:adenosylmethionine---8-amino-7-oxononanoate aminotransferase